jgi:hypothetical protein
MKKNLGAFLILLLSICGMSYAVLESGLSAFTARASWDQGCCINSSHCSGELVCYDSGFPPEWGSCGYIAGEDENGHQIQIEAGGYCNTRQNPSWN